MSSRKYSLGNFAASSVEIFEVHATDRDFFGWFSRGGNEAHRNRSIHAVGHEQVAHWGSWRTMWGFGHLGILEAKIGLRG